MKTKKPRRLFEARVQSSAETGAAVVREAPGFLVRLVGKDRAKSLCQGDVVQPRRD
jgi:hypothetical protein